MHTHTHAQKKTDFRNLFLPKLRAALWDKLQGPDSLEIVISALAILSASDGIHFGLKPILEPVQ